MTDRDDVEGWVFVGLLLASLALHAFVFTALAWVPTAREAALALSLAEIAVDVLEPEPAVSDPLDEETPAEELLPEEPEPPPPPPRERLPEEPPPEPDPPPEPPPAQETPVAFDNIVLTNDDGDSSFQVQQGSGVDREGPIGTPGAQVTGQSRQGQSGGTVGARGEPEAPRGPRVVAMADLSRRPSPPEGRIASLMQRYYPAQAKHQGVEGRAEVGILINPDGSLTVLGVRSETHAGFGQACQRALRESPRWGAPVGQGGERVAVRSHWTCTFTLY